MMAKAGKKPGREPNRYAEILEHIFKNSYAKGADRVPFTARDLRDAAKTLGIVIPANPPDILYSFRYRNEMPHGIRGKAPRGMVWIILSEGRAKYVFRLCPEGLANIVPNSGYVQTKIPDATPGIIARYAKTDEQALLARLRYNRMIDLFSGVTCYSLQSHFKTSVKELGQVETDELYAGLDKLGAHYVFPVQAKGGRDRISIVQIQQDIALCAEKFPDAICRPIAAQFMPGGGIALFEFQPTHDWARIRVERHYQLVPQEALKPAEVAQYKKLAQAE